jgi:hypothetical protein
MENFSRVWFVTVFGRSIEYYQTKRVSDSITVSHQSEAVSLPLLFHNNPVYSSNVIVLLLSSENETNW